MIEIEENREVYISSDFHFDHKNICRGVSAWKDERGEISFNRTRPFKDLDEMNNTIVNNINSCVGQDDVLIFLGDFAFNGFENIKKFRDRIICKEIYFVIGNHDKHIKNNKDNIQELFKMLPNEEELIYRGVRSILNHYPVSSWYDLNKGTLMLHGHLHLAPNDKFTGDGKTMDCGIDGHPEFRPYNLRREIYPIMEKRPIASSIAKDRHGKTEKIK